MLPARHDDDEDFISLCPSFYNIGRPEIIVSLRCLGVSVIASDNPRIHFGLFTSVLTKVMT